MNTPDARHDAILDAELQTAVDAVRRRDASLVAHLDTMARQLDEGVTRTRRRVASGASATAVVAGVWMLVRLLRPAPRRVTTVAAGERVVRVEPKGMGVLGMLMLVASTVWPMLSQQRHARGAAASPLWQFADAAMGLVRARRWRR